MKKTRIAVAGTGYVGMAHMQAAQDSISCTLCAVVDPDASAGVRAERAGVPCYDSLSDLLYFDRPDGIVLATPNALHVEQALQCIEVGMPILIEKPLAADLAEAEDLVRVADFRNARILVGHHRVHSPIIARARDIIQHGALGRIVAVQGSALFYKPDEYFASAPWRSQTGAGPIFLNLIHEVQNLRALCGEIVAVQATSANAIRAFPVEDTVAITLTFASGALGSFLLSDTAASARSWEHTSQENPEFPSYPDEDCYLIAGTRGSLSIPTMRIRQYRHDAPASWWEPFAEGVAAMVRTDPMLAQMEHFGAVARGEARPLVTVHDGLANLRVIDAVAESARTGARITLDE